MLASVQSTTWLGPTLPVLSGLSLGPGPESPGNDFKTIDSCASAIAGTSEQMTKTSCGMRAFTNPPDWHTWFGGRSTEAPVVLASARWSRRMMVRWAFAPSNAFDVQPRTGDGRKGSSSGGASFPATPALIKADVRIRPVRLARILAVAGMRSGQRSIVHNRCRPRSCTTWA